MKKYLFAPPLLFFIGLLAGCISNKAKIDDSLKIYFDARSTDGCFTMLDNGTGRITVYNIVSDTSRVLPAETFTLAEALTGLQTGKITNEDMVLAVGGNVNAQQQKLSMTEALKIGSAPYFQEVARRIGHDTLSAWVDSLSYGNKNTAGPVDSIGMNNVLKISPDEQLGLLKKLYFEQLSFRKGAQEAVKEAMLQKDNTAYKLSYLKGKGRDEIGHIVGWMIGWIEENGHVYFFVTMLNSAQADFDTEASLTGITTDILKHLGFYEGKK